MARPKQKWTSEEEEALAAGVEKYGQGRWKHILADQQFAPILNNRSNVDLKDKWRNLSGSDYGSNSRGNVRTSPVPEISNLLLLTYLEPSSTRSRVKKRSPPYWKLINEAFSSIGDPNGTDASTMLKFLESKYELCKTFSRSFTTRLNQLVELKVLEKVGNRYKIMSASSSAETSQLDVCTDNDDDNNEEQGISQNLIEEQVGPENRNEEQVGLENCNEEEEESRPREALEDATSVAAFLVAAAEQAEVQLTKACEERDKVAELLQESMAMLRVAEDLYEQCKRGEQVILPP